MSNYSKIEWATLAFDEWKYRHDNYWKSVYRWCLAITTVLIIPFVRPEIIVQIENATLLFPALAIFIATIAFLHLITELDHIDALRNAYTEYSPEKHDPAEIGQPEASSNSSLFRFIIRTIPQIIACGTLVLSILEWIILGHFIPTPAKHISLITFYAYLFVALVAAVLFICLFARISRKS